MCSPSSRLHEGFLVQHVLPEQREPVRHHQRPARPLQTLREQLRGDEVTGSPRSHDPLLLRRHHHHDHQHHHHARQERLRHGTNHQYRPGRRHRGGSHLPSEPVRPAQEQPHPEPLRPAAGAPEPVSQPQPSAARQPHQLAALDPARLPAPQTGHWTGAPSSSRARKL
ncbi:hypothetical protein D9C73_004566 [Collichthys lucidus]|uniref:Uncharacterized protein n=1 Tax=Collichthys lucidus TaxID=240159 RepID=A0A4U5U842_COLLU|nr:hypothetical protein D9C73_004566 [Collichthys lucidus]